MSFTDVLSAIIDNRGRTCPIGAVGLPLIATNCVKNDGLYPRYETERFVDERTYATWFRGHPEPGDILFVCKGSPGSVAVVPDPVDFCIAQDMVAVRADRSKIYPRYLFAALRSPDVQSQIATMHVGTMIPHFKKGDFGRLLIPMLDETSQQFAGDLYFELSSKVESNRQLVRTLNALVQAQFDETFSSRPLEQEVLGLAGVFDCLHTKKPQRTESGPQLLQLSNILDDGLIDTANHYPISELDYTRWTSNIEVVRGDIVVTNVGRVAAIGRVPTGLRAALGRNMTAVRPLRSSDGAYLAAAFCNRRVRAEFAKLVDSGTIMDALNVHAIRRIVLPAGSGGERADFGAAVGPLLDRIDLAMSESQALAAIRDAILPELLSGRLRVREAQRVIEDLV